MYIDIEVGMERITSSWYFESLIQCVSSGFPLVGILLCQALDSYLVYVRILYCMYMHLLAKTDSSKEVYM